MKTTYVIVFEVSLWERKESPNGAWKGSSKIARKVISFEIANVAAGSGSVLRLLSDAPRAIPSRGNVKSRTIARNGAGETFFRIPDSGKYVEPGGSW